MRNKKENLEEVLKFVKKNKDVAIYGAGKVGVGLYRDLKSLGIEIKYFIVTSGVGQKSEIEGCPILEIDKIPNLLDMGIIIGVSLGKVSGIQRMLMNYGITNYITLEQKYLDTILDEFNLPKMEITTVIGCAVNCKYCPQKLLTMKYWEKDKKRCKEMSLQTFKSCIDKLPANTQIYFAGMSEAFLNKDCINMIQYAIERKYPVGVYTTGVGLCLADCEKLIEMPIESVIIHVPDEENYAHIKVTEEYWLVIEKLLNAKKWDGSMFVDSGSCQGTPLKKFMDLNNGRIRIESYLHDRAGNLDSHEAKLETCDFIDGEIYCYHSGERLDHNILLPDGTVLLCCMDYGMKHSIGNLLESTYEEIMNGKELDFIRKSLKVVNDSTRTLLCRNCTYAIKYKN